MLLGDGSAASPAAMLPPGVAVSDACHATLEWVLADDPGARPTAEELLRDERCVMQMTCTYYRRPCACTDSGCIQK